MKKIEAKMKKKKNRSQKAITKITIKGFVNEIVDVQSKQKKTKKIKKRNKMTKK